MLCCSSWGYPPLHPDLRSDLHRGGYPGYPQLTFYWGTPPPILTWDEGTPSQEGWGYPTPDWEGWGTPLPVRKDGVSPGRSDGGTPSVRWGPPQSDGVPLPPRNVNRQTPVKTVPSPFLRNAGGRNPNPTEAGNQWVVKYLTPWRVLSFRAT